MLISSSQVACMYSIGNLELVLKISGTSLERLDVAKLLGVHIDSNLKWEFHINSIFKSCYATLRILRKIRNFTDFKLRKHLGETLILSKISYCDIALILYRSSSQPDYTGSSSLSLVFFNYVCKQYYPLF